ncbi:uncharacterized protein LOC128727829 [Anopheles nili]|uniref:uncharacterized protein LOC128727829 n=1 Tax=Anopheles nili TaxID=185578 RepID=UPI00237A4C26|nr:uncharacterized protein LOC128727829 [Anopheles nili]
MALGIKSGISSIKWIDFQEHMLSIYHRIFECHQHADCRLIVADGELHANRLVLSMASAFFDTIFSSIMCEHVAGTDPLTVLIPDITLSAMRLILVFIHTGEVNLRLHDLASFMEGCSLLQVRGILFSGDRVGGIYVGKFPASTSAFVDEVSERVVGVEVAASESTAVLVENESHAGAEEENSLTGQLTDDGRFIADGNKHGISVMDATAAEETDDNEYYDVMEEVMANAESLPCSSGAESIPVPVTADDGCKPTATRQRSQDLAEYDTHLKQSCEAVNAGEPLTFTNPAESIPVPLTTDDLSKRTQSQQKKGLDLTEYDMRLNQASEAVLSEGISYRLASLQYNVAKSVLWRNTRKLSHAEKCSVHDELMTKPVSPVATTECDVIGPPEVCHGDIAPFETQTTQDLGSYATRLSAAIDAVLNQGVSYRIASLRYSIAKTVLWRKTMKMPRTLSQMSQKVGSARREAIDAIKSGEKLLNVSRRFEIPLSTLHRDKIRLYSSGVLPTKVTLKQRDKGEQFKQRLIEASQECVAGRMSLSEAARVYSLPKTSIWRKVRSQQADGGGCDVTAGRVKRKKKNPDDIKAQHRDVVIGAGETVWRANESMEADSGYVPVSNMDVSTADLADMKIVHIYDHHGLSDSLQ